MNKNIIFQPTYPQFSVAQGGESLSQQLRTSGRSPLEQDHTHPYTPPPTHTYMHTHSLSLGQWRHTHSPHILIFEVWEATRVPRENADMRERANSTQTEALSGNQFFPPHQLCSEMTLGEMMLSRTCCFSSLTTSSCR